MKQSESIKTLAAAMVKAQAAMTYAKKDSANPFFKSKYADMSSVVDAVKGPLMENGIAYLQFPVSNDKSETGVETMLMHSSGEWLLTDPVFVPVNKADAQSYGSAMTYVKRYSLQAICGVPSDDDDGNAAVKSTVPKGASLLSKVKGKEESASGAASTTVPVLPAAPSTVPTPPLPTHDPVDDAEADYLATYGGDEDLVPPMVTGMIVSFKQRVGKGPHTVVVQLTDTQQETFKLWHLPDKYKEINLPDNYIEFDYEDREREFNGKKYIDKTIVDSSFVIPTGGAK